VHKLQWIIDSGARLRYVSRWLQPVLQDGLCYFMPESRHSRRRDDGIGIKVKTLIGCVNAKRPLNIEEASVKWNHLLLELASLDVLSTRRATDASRPGCRCVTYELHCDPGANCRCPGVCSVLANTIQSNPMWIKGRIFYKGMTKYRKGPQRSITS